MERMMEHDRPMSRAKTLAMTGLFAALSCVATMVLVVPSPTHGYMNLGDAMVLLGAYLLGPFYGAIAGGVGAALADLLAGYAMYVPATLVIKVLMGLLAGTLYGLLREKRGGVLLCGIMGEIPMVVGYWLYDGIWTRSLVSSAAGIPSNLVQAAFGILASTLLAAALRKISYVRQEFPRL